MITHMHLFRMKLKDRFPNAQIEWDKVRACWNVSYSDGHTMFTDSYRFQDFHKMIRVNTIEVEK